MNHNAYVDRELLERAIKVSGGIGASAVLTKALEEYLARRSPKRIQDLIGKLAWDPTYDHKGERSRN